MSCHAQVETGVSRATHRSIFGLFNVPAKFYPWALLGFWQLLMPGASFLGHLCGVAVGTSHHTPHSDDGL